MKYAILEKNIRYNENLSANEKLLYAELMLYQEDSKVELDSYEFLYKLLGFNTIQWFRKCLGNLENQNLIKLNKLSEKGLSLELYSATKPNPKPKQEKRQAIKITDYYAQIHTMRAVNCSQNAFVKFCEKRHKARRQKLSDESLTKLINKINAVDNLQKADELLDEAREKGWASIYPKEPKAQSTAHQTHDELYAELQSKGYGLTDIMLSENESLTLDGKTYKTKMLGGKRVVYVV